MDFLDHNLLKYTEQHTSKESDVLGTINRETHVNILRPRMLSGHLQGRILSMISHMIKPRRILEIGTYTGYSAICLAEGLADDGKIITVDVNEELEDRVRGYFAGVSFSHKIDYRVGNALTIIPQLNDEFDLVFIDADKENYLRYYNLILDKVRPGGFILADNVLWSGKVLDKMPDKDTRAILAFNKAVLDDPRVENVLVPVRDGIMMIRKLSL